MPNENANKSSNDQTPKETPESDILLSRIVDQQATKQDQHRFEQLADKDPSLWRTLSQQQQDMAALSNTVIEQLVEADLVELPASTSSSLAATITLKPFAFVGWAAALIIAAVWIMLPAGESNQANPKFTSDYHLDEYRKAEFLTQELDPIMLDWERLDEKRIKIYYMRRFEEFIIVDRPLKEIIDGDKFLVTPEELRKDSSPMPKIVDQ